MKPIEVTNGAQAVVLGQETRKSLCVTEVIAIHTNYIIGYYLKEDMACYIKLTN